MEVNHLVNQIQFIMVQVKKFNLTYQQMVKHYQQQILV